MSRSQISPKKYNKHKCKFIILTELVRVSQVSIILWWYTNKTRHLTNLIIIHTIIIILRLIIEQKAAQFIQLALTIQFLVVSLLSFFSFFILTINNVCCTKHVNVCIFIDFLQQLCVSV